MLALSFLLCGFALSGYLLLKDRQVHAAARIEARALGRSFDPSSEDARLLAQQLAHDYLRQPITLEVDGKVASRSRAELGVQVDQRALLELLRDAADSRSPLRKLHAQRRARDVLELPVPASLDAARAEPWVRALAARVDTPPRHARVDLARGTVIQPSAGRSLDVQATLDALEQAVYRGATRVLGVVRPVGVATHVEPGRLELGTVLGSFESEPAPGLAQTLGSLARALDGTLLLPGETFDFRALVGAQRGQLPLQVGPVTYEGDRAEAALAQVAGVLYASALFAGLPVLEQHARVHPLETLELGLEAAIGADQNLRFQNDRGAPLALSLSVRDGRVRAALHGPSGEGREVELERLVERTAPIVELAHTEPNLTLGARSVLQRGLPGLRVTLSRTVRRSGIAGGEHVERDVSYQPVPRIVAVGSGRGAGQAPRSDERGEPLFDEYVSLSMRPGFALPEESARREGLTGSPGWTAQPGR